MSESTAVAAGSIGSIVADAPDAPDEDLVDELLVEEISIDGMCGVY